MSRLRPRVLRVVAAGVGSALVLAAMSGSLRPLAAAAATPVTVSTTNDVVDGNVSSVSALVASRGADNSISLREAIEAANNTTGPVEIDVPAGTYTLTTGAGFGQLAVGTVSGSNISIAGAGPASTTIQGDGTDRVFSLDPGLVGNITVAISGVTITGGHDQDGLGGAGIIGGNPSPPDTTSLSNCAVTNNSTTTSSTNSPGGGIQYIGGTLTVDGCTISDNSASSSAGGGIDYETFSPHTGTFHLTNSTVTGNTLTNTDSGAFVGGAGVHVQAETGSSVTVSGDTFTGNTATAGSTGPVGGGGLWLEGSASVSGSTFTGNQANGPSNTLAGGGALNLTSGTTTLSFNRIVGNAASNGPAGLLNDGVQAVTTATDNWWGCNTGPGATPCDRAANSGGGTGSLTYTPWLTLTATASPAKVLEHGTATVTAGLTRDSNGTDTSASGHVPDGITVGFAADSLGLLTAANGTLSSGTAATTFTAGTATGNSTVTVTVDGRQATATIGIGIPPAIISANGTTFTATLANTFQVTATGTPAPTFSETGALPGTVTLSSSGLLSGTFPQIAATTTYPITITATNGYGTDDTQSFTLTVIPFTQAPSITSATSTSFTEGVAGSTFTVTASGTPTPTLSEDAGDPLPAGVTFDPTTGVLSGTPAAGSHGTYPLHLTATNGVLPAATQTFTLTVGLPPAITSAPSTTFTVGTAGSFPLTTTGFPGPSITEDPTDRLPSGVTFGSGALGGTPAAGTGGTYTLHFTASNGFGSNATQTFTLTVDEAPSITSADHSTFTVGTAGTFTMTATGFPVPTLSAGTGLPTGVTFGAGTISGTPAALTGGTHSVTLTASNGVAPAATQTFTLTVDEAPSFTSANGATFTVGSTRSFELTATGFPGPTFSVGGMMPSGVTLSNGVLSGTPDAGTGGFYNLTLTATNGIGADAHQAFTLTVDEAAAFTSGSSTTFTVGTSGSFPVTATGTPEPALSLGNGATLPQGVTFNTSTDTLEGTPALHSGSTYTFDLVAHNGIGADAVQHFSLTVNEAPAITSDPSTSFVVGSAGSFSVTAGGFPIPALSEDAGDPALTGGITFDATTGALSGTPAPSAAGDYTLHFTASNGVNPDAHQTFTLHVDQVPAFASASSTTFTVGSYGTQTVTATGFPVPALSESPADTLPSGVTFDPTTGALTGTPAVGSGGIYTLHFTASNAVQPDAQQTFTLTIDEGAAFTSPSFATFTTGVAGQTATITAGGEPAPPITEDPSDHLPSGMTFDPTTAILGGTPGAGSGGTYTLHFAAFNLIGSPALQTFTLTVDQPPAITSAGGTTFTAGQAGSFSLTASGFPAPGFTENPSDALPTGVSFDAATGVLSGTPEALTGGTYALSFTASNAVGADATQTFSLTVDEAPAFSSLAATTFTTLNTANFSVTATGFPTPTLSLGGDDLPAGVTFDAANGLLSGGAADGTAGDYALVFTAHNGIGAGAVQGFTLTVQNATTTTLTSSTAHSVLHQPVTLTATVTADTGRPGGPVLFMDGSTTLGAGALAVSGGVDRATYTTASGDLAAGSHSITAVYAGDALDTTSSSAAVTVVVSTVTTVTVSPHSHTLRATGATHTPVVVVVTDAGGQPVAGDTVTLSAAPAGRVTFTSGTVTTDSTGTARTVMQSSTTAGPVTVTATDGFGNVTGTATEKLLGTGFKTAALSATRILADGSSTTTATALVVDGSGAPVAGEPVTFSTEGRPGDATLAQPAVTTDSQGVASDTLTSSTTANIQAITVSDDNSDSGDNFATVLALTQLPAAGPSNASFIHNACVTLLGRDVDPPALAYWLNLLDHGTSRTALAEALASSPEYRNDVVGGTSTVPGFYAQYLGRPSDPGGVAFWVGVMAAGGSFEQVRLGFLTSPEYPQHHGNDPSATIEALYEDVLGRPSDPTGKAYWLANYNVATIATQFIHSPEGRAHLVTVLYGGILNRAPDPQGLGYWNRQLLSGAPDEYVIGALLGSDEYYLTH